MGFFLYLQAGIKLEEDLRDNLNTAKNDEHNEPIRSNNHQVSESTYVSNLSDADLLNDNEIDHDEKV